MPLPVFAFGTDAPYRLSKFSCSLSAFADSRGNVKDVLCYSIFKEQQRQKVPLTFHAEKVRAHNQKFLFFQ